MITKGNILFHLVQLASQLDTMGFHKEANMADDILMSLTKNAKESRTKESRTNFVFPPDSPKVNDDKGHYPLGDANQARNALSRASQHTKKPPWYSGSLDQLVNTVQRKVKEEYPSIETTEKSSKPGKD